MTEEACGKCGKTATKTIYYSIRDTPVRLGGVAVWGGKVHTGERMPLCDNCIKDFKKWLAK